MRKGLTLIELLITVVMIAILTGVTAYVFRAVLLSWSSQETRAGIDIGLDRGIEEMVKDLREAEVVTSVNDEIRFTTTSNTFHIYYLYSVNDTYPPDFGQALYELRKADLASAVADPVDPGRIIITDILPPTVSDLSMSGNIVTIDLSIKRKDETIRSETQVKPRNLFGALQLREHRLYAGYDAVIAFVKPTSSSIRMRSYPNSSKGYGYIFAVFPKSVINGKKLKLTWQTYSSLSRPAFFARIYDGSYDRGSMVDFPDKSGIFALTKGVGLLQTIEDITGSMASHTVTIYPVDVSAAESDFVTIFIMISDAWTDTNMYIIVSDLLITDSSDNVEYSADLAGDLVMGQDGKYNDFGLVGLE